MIREGFFGKDNSENNKRLENLGVQLELDISEEKSPEQGPKVLKLSEIPSSELSDILEDMIKESSPLDSWLDLRDEFKAKIQDYEAKIQNIENDPELEKAENKIMRKEGLLKEYHSSIASLKSRVELCQREINKYN
ncbi:hypothetical protein KC842_00630 [Candidatus Nomurabacteria bacterium]|nr:hypothetical protein [Candidatus Nomurabacteria bacterium]USN94925.1 MAG: hypothetical protein H6791_00655 [Candidatus Nomurabacteria bacterium]